MLKIGTGGKRQVVGQDLRLLRQREVVEELLRRAPALDAGERALIEAVFKAGRSAAQIAMLTGERKRLVRARVRRLMARALSREFEFVMMRACRWPRMVRLVAEQRFIRGLSMREVGRALDMRLHTVRKHCEWVKFEMEVGEEEKGAAA
jgi:DNA-directed RNA polymerase specialized sigma24 family protein